MNECAECGQPATKQLCALCINSLQQWIDKIPGYLVELPAAIYRLDNVRPTTPDGGGGSGTSGSREPINLDAYQIRENLLTVNANAETYADDKFAAGIAETIRLWVSNAEKIISGPEPEYVDHNEIRQRVEKAAPPMPTRKLVPWLRENARIALTGKDIRNWAQRGKLTPASRTPSPTYWPHEVVKVHRETRKPTP